MWRQAIQYCLWSASRRPPAHAVRQTFAGAGNFRALSTAAKEWRGTQESHRNGGAFGSYRRWMPVVVVLLAGASVDTAQLKEKKGFKQQFDVGKKLGEGTYGTVWLVKDKDTGEKYAAKILKKSPKNRRLMEMLTREVEIMDKLGKHPNLVSLIDKFEEDQELILIFDLVNGGELFDYIVQQGKISEKEASRLLRQVAEALRVMHTMGLCHNDLKPENLLLSSKSANATVKLADFGTSLYMSEPTMMDKPTGTAAYRAPEIILHEKCERGVDVWAFGIVMYIMLCGSHPFDLRGNSTNAQIMMKIIDGKPDENKVYRGLSAPAKDLLARLLDPNPETRYTIDQALAHPWLNGKDAPDTPLPEIQAERFRGYNALRSLRVGAMAIAASFKTNVALAKKYYLEDPDCKAAKELDKYDDITNLDAEVFRQAFRIYDKNGDGSISAAELASVFRSLGQNPTAAELKMLVAEADLNGDGVISIDEFCGMMKRRMMHACEGAKQEELRNIFKIFDRDGNGKLDRSELEYILNNVLGQKVPAQLIDQMIKEADKNNDGHIDYEEFASYLGHLFH